MRRITYILIFLLSFPFLLISAELLYPCYKITEEPIIDGKIEDNVWSSIPAATDFYISRTDVYASKQTYFKAGWNKEGIYIAVKCEEPDVEKILAKQPDEGNLFEEDSIELFFFPKESDKYFQFVVNAIGSKWNSISSIQLSDWQAKVFVDGNYWSLEVKIPFEILGRVPENGEKWAVNIARNILTCPEERYTCWPPLKSGFHDISNFGSFIFVETKLDYQNYLKNKINEIVKYYPEYNEIIEKAIKTPKFKEEGISLKENWELAEEVLKKKEASIEELYTVLSKSYNLLQRVETLKPKILLETLFEEE